MEKAKYMLLFISTLMISTIISAIPPQPTVIHENWESISHSNYVMDIAIEDNYVWCATKGGVVQWDVADSTYVVYRIEHGLAHNVVYSVDIDSSGLKWFETLGGRSRFDGETWVTVTDSVSYPSNVSDKEITAYGATWSGTWDGVVKTEGDTQTTYLNVWNGSSEPDGNPVHDIKLDKNNVLWVATSRGVSSYDGEIWTTYTQDDGLPYTIVWTIAIGDDNSKWFGSGGGPYGQGGLSRLQEGEWTNYYSSEDLLSTRVNTIVSDGDFMRIGTSNGISSVDIHTRNMLEEPIYMPSGMGSSIFSMFIDVQGAQWFGTTNGVTRLKGDTFTTWTQYEYSTGHTVDGITVDSGGDMWFATWSGVSRFDGEHWTLYETEDGLPDERVYAIAIDADGTVWCGTDAGVGIFDGQNWSAYTVADGLANDKVSCVVIDSDGVKWFGTDGGVSRYDGEYWATYTVDDGLAGNEVSAIAIDKLGNKWFGTNSGVSRFDGEHWKTYTSSDGLTQNQINCIAIDKDNVIWFGTTDSGISVLKSDIISAVEEDVVPNPFITTNYPNPFNPSTTITYSLAESGLVTVRVFNLSGQLVETLVDEPQVAGSHAIAWRPDNLASGIYLYRVESKSLTGSGKMMFIK